MNAGDIMTSNVGRVRPDTSISALARLLGPVTAKLCEMAM